MEYEPCPNHPGILLPVAKRRGEKHLCYLCAQAGRQVTYLRQKLEAEAIFKTGPGGPQEPAAGSTLP